MAGCGGPAPSAAPPLPRTLPGGWRLVRSAELPADAAPAEVRALKPLAVVEGRYEDRSNVVVTAYRFPAGVAFEALQKWRHAPGAVAFHHDPWLIACEGAGSADLLIEFSRQFEQAWLSGATSASR
jgi:hypothetical protein